MPQKPPFSPTLLAIESSCDETSASIIRAGKILSNVTSSQPDHADFGGVIPELASRLHQQHIVKVVNGALNRADISPGELDAIAFTRGPGLMGALLVGVCFAKAYAWGLNIPLIEVDHMQAHVVANHLSESPPPFPFLCLTVSGGHTQLSLVKDYLDIEVIGKTIDDAAGEAFDKAAKLLGYPYPGGPLIDQWAKQGNGNAFSFSTPSIGGYDFSFSGIKTQFLYLLRDQLKINPDFIEQEKANLCASWQNRIVSILLDKTAQAAQDLNLKHIALAGGVAANSALREGLLALCAKHKWQAHIPAFEYCTDNAAMIAITAHHKFLAGDFCGWDAVPFVKGNA